MVFSRSCSQRRCQNKRRQAAILFNDSRRLAREAEGITAEMRTKRKMNRLLEPVDLMVAAGSVATVVGVLLVFVSTQGRFQVGPSDDIGNTVTRDSLQPVLGQTLVSLSLVERERSGEMRKAVASLNDVTMAAHQIKHSAHEQVKELANQANNDQFSTAARAEFVKGRSVVNFTTRMVRNDSLTNGQREEYDHRMIAAAAEAGKKIEQDFERTEESHLGRVIVAKTQSQIHAAHRNQEQIGAAIVRVTLVQDEKKKVIEAAQEQLGVLVSVTTQAQL